MAGTGKIAQITNNETMAKIRMNTSLNIQGALKWRKNLKGLFLDEDGKETSDKEAREYLNECLAKGWKKLPMCREEECPDFDHVDKGCPGHVLEK